MARLAFTLALMFFVFFSGYFMGRKQIIDEIKQLTKELKEK